MYIELWLDNNSWEFCVVFSLKCFTEQWMAVHNHLIVATWVHSVHQLLATLLYCTTQRNQ